MTNRDYIRAANMIRDGKKFGRADRALLILFFVQFFADNPRFDAEKFVAACQPEPKPRNVKKRDMRVHLHADDAKTGPNGTIVPPAPEPN